MFANKNCLMLAAAAASVILAHTASADACTINNATVTKEKYWPTTAYSSTTDNRCNDDGTCRLRGVLAKPTSATQDAPVLVYVHGSGTQKNVENMCDFLEYFVGEGYVVWMPFMRGVSNSSAINGIDQSFSNSGVYISDWVSAAPTTSSDLLELFSMGITLPNTQDYNALHTTQYMRREVRDIEASLTYLLSLPGPTKGTKLVAANKIALTGHSYGAATVLLGAEMGVSPQPRAVVSMSAGVLSWGGSSVWKHKLSDAAAGSHYPLFLFQTTNEAVDASGNPTVEPVLLPFKAANEFGSHPAQMSIFSDVPGINTANCGSTPLTQCAHIKLIDDGQQMMRWAPQVVAFVTKWGVK